MRPLVPKGILSVRQTGIGHSSFSSGVSSFGLELIFETIIPVQVTTTTQRYIPIPNAQHLNRILRNLISRRESKTESTLPYTHYHHCPFP